MVIKSQRSPTPPPTLSRVVEPPHCLQPTRGWKKEQGGT